MTVGVTSVQRIRVVVHFFWLVNAFCCLGLIFFRISETTYFVSSGGRKATTRSINGAPWTRLYGRAHFARRLRTLRSMRTRNEHYGAINSRPRQWPMPPRPACYQQRPYCMLHAVAQSLTPKLTTAAAKQCTGRAVCELLSTANESVPKSIINNRINVFFSKFRSPFC